MGKDRVVDGSFGGIQILKIKLGTDPKLGIPALQFKVLFTYPNIYWLVQNNLQTPSTPKPPSMMRRKAAPRCAGAEV